MWSMIFSITYQLHIKYITDYNILCWVNAIHIISMITSVVVLPFSLVISYLFLQKISHHPWNCAIQEVGHMDTAVSTILAIMTLTGDGNWYYKTLEWRHNGRDSVSNHQHHDCSLNRLLSADHRKHQSSASLAFVRGIHRWPMNSPHKWPVPRKRFPFDSRHIYHRACLKTFPGGIMISWYHHISGYPILFCIGLYCIIQSGVSCTDRV